ncbi:MAG TPA: aspartate 1-decarboxylase [Oligoflexia bacterium]|nr:aspartate 1-decarboxylase [Oligoflexia bacterium]HMP47814.1 aspartate 1-decarboxylase [Oligoflexia bacterium]
MIRRVLRSKIHRACVTAADTNYEGSISLSPELLKAADIVPYEAVEVWNVTNGNRFQTYAILGEAESLDISINGAAAHLCSPGDIIIIACFGYYNSTEVLAITPKVIFVDDKNRISGAGSEVPGPSSPGPSEIEKRKLCLV